MDIKKPDPRAFEHSVSPCSPEEAEAEYQKLTAEEKKSCPSEPSETAKLVPPADDPSRGVHRVWAGDFTGRREDYPAWGEEFERIRRRMDRLEKRK